jgi:hypothetical protein
MDSIEFNSLDELIEKMSVIEFGWIEKLIRSELTEFFSQRLWEQDGEEGRAARIRLEQLKDKYSSRMSAYREILRMLIDQCEIAFPLAAVRQSEEADSHQLRRWIVDVAEGLNPWGDFDVKIRVQT